MPSDHPVPTYRQVQNLPYLNAVVQEFLRLHPGVLSRMPRIAPDNDIIYHNKRHGTTHVIPAGTSAAMSALISHTDPEVFENPYEFHPQRWLDSPKLDKVLITFSRGSRNCIGCVMFFEKCATTSLPDQFYQTGICSPRNEHNPCYYPEALRDIPRPGRAHTRTLQYSAGAGHYPSSHRV
jgi:hypothetical protein